MRIKCPPKSPSRAKRRSLSHKAALKLQRLGIDISYIDQGIRAPEPALVALQLATRGYRLLAIHGVVLDDTGKPECACLKRQRKMGNGLASCQMPGKKPLIADWPHVASSSVHFVLELRERFCQPNFAVLTGLEGGVWILDVDGEEGRARMAQLEVEHGLLPRTWTTVSGRDGGGEHRWFAPKPGGPDLKTVAHAMIGGKRSKIDQKGRGGYAVLPGSMHISGARYSWAAGCAPGELQLASLPPQWAEILDYVDNIGPKASSKSGGKPSKSRNLNHDACSLVIGDGAHGGGFHGPINRNCVKYFGRESPTAPVQPLKDWLVQTITAAAKDPGRSAEDIMRYISNDYLDAAIESARNYVRKNFYNA